jgi:1,4-alpha-glucan branching enzyme
VHKINLGSEVEDMLSDSLVSPISLVFFRIYMTGHTARVSQAVVAALVFFALIGKPLSTLAAPSTQVGLGSIPYSGIWSNGSQDGSGFGAWQLSQPTNGPSVFFYVNSSTQTDNGSAPGNGSNDINTAGVAWGMTAFNGALASATRPFPSALTNGQVFQVDMDNGFINTGGAVGFALQNSSGNAVWQYYFSGGSNTYTIGAASVSGSALPNFTDVGMHLTFTLTSATVYSLSVLAYTPGGAAGAGTTYNYTGTLLNPSGGQSITGVRLFNLNAGSGTNFNAYFNNLSISGGVASDTASNAAYNTPGTTFRVWAPNASAVDVAGSWNQFRTNATPLYAEGNGNWSADVTGALNGNQYEYYISNSTVGTNFFKLDPRCREQVSETGNSIIYNTTSFNWSGDAFTTPGLSNVVVYELHCGSFYDPGFPGSPGTFYNATNLLPQLQRVGINAIEVMPIAGCGSFNWGYDPADIFGVESSYGGPDAFKTFVKIAHQYGMAVLVDTVHNHYGGLDGPTYGDLSYTLWDFDGYGGGLNGGGIYFNPTNGWCCTPYGPRPNTSTTQVCNFIQDNITEWLSECHVDGFRWDDPSDWMNGSNDGTNIFIASAQSLIEQISSMIHTAYVGKINIDENSGYLSGVSGFDSTWYSSPFQGDVVSQLTATNDALRNMGSISTAVNANNNGAGASGWGNVFFTDTHDSAGDLNGGQRVPVLVDSNAPTSHYARKLSTMGAAAILTSAGIPMILQGAEMLVTNQFSATNPLNWSLTNTYSGIVSLYTDLIHLRLNLNGRSSGLEGLHTSTILEDNVNKLIAYRRWNTGNVGDDVIVICNFANTNWPAYNVGNFPHTNIWYTQFNSDWTKYSSDYGNYGSASTTVSVNSTTGTVSIAPYSVLVLSQNIPGAPPTPQNIQVTSVGTNQVSFDWNISSGATGYIVNRGTNQIATTSATNYTDTGLASGVQYCYSVEATNIGGVSAPSATICATTLPATGATNLLAYWTFDEGAGTIAYDYSGNSNTGTVVLGNDGDGWVPGIINGALSFDGAHTVVTVPNSSSLNPVNGVTLAAWINAGGFWTGNNRILEKGASDNQYALLINGSGQLEFLVADVTNVVASPPSAGAWHYVAGTYDGSSVISLYIDGQLATQQLATGSIPVTTDSLAIGNKPSGSPVDDFYGAIDDVRIYGSALPAAQISQLYNFDSVGDGIPNWWRLLWFGSSSSTNTSACTACCAACDADGTGQNNFFKYVAGLNPTDPTQIFVLQIVPSNQVMNLTFGPINSTNSYIVQSSPDLVNYSGLACSSAQSVGSSQITVTDCAPWPSNEFYRVHISLP